MIFNVFVKLRYDFIFSLFSSWMLYQYMDVTHQNGSVVLDQFYLVLLPILYTLRIVIWCYIKIKPIFLMMHRRFKWWKVIFDLSIFIHVLFVSVLSWLQMTLLLSLKFDIHDIIIWHTENGLLILNSLLWILIIVVIHRYWFHSMLFEAIIVMFLFNSQTIHDIINISSLKRISWWYLLIILFILMLLYMTKEILIDFRVDIKHKTRYNNNAVERSLRSPDDGFIGKKSR